MVGFRVDIKQQVIDFPEWGKLFIYPIKGLKVMSYKTVSKRLVLMDIV